MSRRNRWISQRRTLMMSAKHLFLLAAVIIIGLLPLVTVAQEVATYSPVTDQRLLKPEPHNWLMYRGTYDGWGYSPLDKINATNVKKLVPVWSLSTGVIEGHQAPPIVNDGVMFITTPQNQVFALDAKTGDLLWRHKRELPDDIILSHPTNRGVGLYDDKVYFGTLDCHLVALDAKTGKVVWDKTVDDYKSGYYLTLAPAVSMGFAAISRRTTPRQAKKCGRPTRYRVPASQGMTLGPATSGKPGECRRGSPATMIRSST
jgi:alcohol dehydrogenase (cytochrome c)